MMTTCNIEKNLTDECRWMRNRIVELAHKAGKKGAHVGGSLSCVEILCSLYASLSNKTGDERDRVILSKGHAALALYSILEHKGILSASETDTFELNGTHYYAHCPRDISKGLEFSGGSLSLGVSFGVGVALSCLKRGLNNHIYIIIGDGECNEGLVWESIMSASNYGLNNITFIVDCNAVQLDGTTKEIMNTLSLAEKFIAFGCDTVEVDGHSLSSMLKAFKVKSDKPKAIIAHTIKGKGLSFCEGLSSWHHNVMTDSLYQQALIELNK